MTATQEAEIPFAEAEIVQDEKGKALAPSTLSQLAGQLDRGLDIIKARAAILETARRAAIRMTSPEDWLLFKDKEGRTVGYLQDAGCDRVRDVYGIEVFDISKPEKIQIGTAEFMYVITGSGRCHLTGQVVESIEGGRSSTDDYIVRQNPPLIGSQMELAVRKSARANLDGGITRALAGLQSVPLEEITEAYRGDTKKTRARFREGRGFSSGAERRGAAVESEWNGEAPNCPTCNAKMVYKSGGLTKDGRAYGAFWSCSTYPKCKGSMKHEDWVSSLPADEQHG